MQKTVGYYVYAFVRSSGVPYYIGKGTKGRAWVKRRKCCCPKPDRSNVRILKDGLTDDEAKALEIQLIQFWGRKEHGGVLVNRTDGGEGAYGWSPNALQRQKLSKAMSGTKLSDERKAEIKEEYYRAIDNDPSLIYRRRRSATITKRSWWTREMYDFVYGLWTLRTSRKWGHGLVMKTYGLTYSQVGSVVKAIDKGLTYDEAIAAEDIQP